ncbi:MAG: radical SAM protein [Gemmatimonadetes bacterium]|nr:radical SAM protein [Gemmatimonadota bacterium]
MAAPPQGAARRSLPVLPVDAAERTPTRVPAGTRVAMITLGCDKNTVDSERILGSLLGAGVEVTTSPEDADVVVVNTCGFIEMAKQESIDTLLEAARLKEAGRVRAVVGIGCLVQRYRPELEAEMPEVDLFLGLTDAARLIPELARRGLTGEGVPLMERPIRMLAGGPRHSAHLKISEGCDHGCAFCAIPLMRGKFRSTPMDLLVREAKELEAAGTVELNIVSQDTTWYGRDWARALARGDASAVTGAEGETWFHGRIFDGMPNADPTGADAAGRPPRRDAPTGRLYRGNAAPDTTPVRAGPVTMDGIGRTGALPLLLRTLLSETAIPWLRLFYMYPSGITPEVVELLAAEDRLLPYLDMPIQHGSDSVLRRMRRPERRATILERVGWLREAIPDLALRTTVIVGFPGETEDEFEELLALLDEVRFDHMGAFAYSEEEDTAAADMADQVPEAVRRERLERVLDLQRQIGREKNEARVGRRVTVLVDEVERGTATARAPWQAPEVDGVVRIEGSATLRPGQMVGVEITDADEHDLIGVPAQGERQNG